MTDEQWSTMARLAASAGASQIDEEKLARLIAAAVRAAVDGSQLQVTGVIDAVGDVIAAEIVAGYEGAV